MDFDASPKRLPGGRGPPPGARENEGGGRQAAAQGAEFTSEQVHAVVETQMAYLRAIGAVGPEADGVDGG